MFRKVYYNYYHHQTVVEPPEVVGVVARYAGSTDGLLATDIHFTEVVNKCMSFTSKLQEIEH